MAVCPKGHASDAGDYCDVCGTPIGAGTVAPASPTPTFVEPGPTRCAVCGANLTGRFCEECGQDSLAVRPSEAPAPTERPEAAEPSAPIVNGWLVMVTADREYFERVQAMRGPDADEVEFPRFCPERRFPLPAAQVLIGRRSRSRGVYPDIDLIGPPEDPAVSHTHALLAPQPGGAWAVVDLRSTNRTFLNGDQDPIEAEVPVQLGDGAIINLGAWTRLTLRGAGGHSADW
jgi:hypothetical protein